MPKPPLYHESEVSAEPLSMESDNYALSGKLGKLPGKHEVH